MMPVTVVTYATRHTDEMSRMAESFRRIGGVDPVVLGAGESHSWQARISAIYGWCNDHRHSSVLCVDAYDTCCVRSLLGIIAHGLVFSAEANCWPDRQRAGDYPPCETRYRYLNAGVWIGEAAAYCGFVEKYGLLSGVDDDQRAYTAAYLDGAAISLDHACHVAHNRYAADNDCEISDGIYWVKSTGTAPLVVHGNGGSGIEDVWGVFGV